MAQVITDTHGELAIIPRQAEVPMRETLEFMTDVMESYNGNEQRLKLRTMARRTLSYTIPLQANHIPGAFNTEYGAIRKAWAVPIWTEPQYIGTVYENQTFIACTTENYDFRFDSLALLYTSCNDWQLLDVNQVQAGGITLYSNTKAFRGAWLVPVRTGYISNIVDRYVNGYSGKSAVTFEIEDNLALRNQVAPPQYLGNDVYVQPGLLTGDAVNRTVEKRLDENDFELGNVERRSPWLNSRTGSSYRRVLKGIDEVFAYRDFFYRRAGRYRLFWMPSFEVNMRLLSVDDQGWKISIASDSFIEYALKKVHIAILVKTTWLFTTITNAVHINESTVQLTLQTQLLNVKTKDVLMVCYNGLHRLDSDRIEINWQGNGVAEVDVRIMEIAP